MYNFLRKPISNLTLIAIIIWSTGLALLPINVPQAEAATVDAILTVQWKAGSDKVAVVFNNWVFNSTDSNMWGPSGALVAADFAITGSAGLTVESVSHDGGSSVAILDLSGNVVDDGTVIVACAATSVYYENGDVCDSSLTKTLQTGTINPIATPFVIDSIDPMGSSVEVEFSHPVDPAGAATNKANYELLTKDGGIDGFGDAADTTFTALSDSSVSSDTNVMPTGWSPKVVRVEAWNADINPSRGSCSSTDESDCDKIKIKAAVADIWGNTLGSDIIQSIFFDAGGDAGSPRVEGVFELDDTRITDFATGATGFDANYDTFIVVFSEDMEETSAETASFYILNYNDDQDCDFSNDTEITSVSFLNSQVVRDSTNNNMVKFSILHTTADITGQDMGSMDPGVCPSNIKVAGGPWAADGPKDLDGNIQDDEWDFPIESSAAPTITGVGVEGNSLTVMFSKWMDHDTVTPAAFTLTTAAADDTSISAATLDWDQRTVILTAANITIADSDTLVVSDAIKDLLAQPVAAGPNRTYTFSTSNLTAPTITRVKTSDLNSNSTIDINDNVLVMFSKDMDRNSGWDVWGAFDLLGGPNCTITDPSDQAAKNNCEEWGYWGDGASMSWGDQDADGSEGDGVDDGCDISPGGGVVSNNCVVITVGQYSNIKSSMKIIPWVDYSGQWGLSDTAGNTVSNVFTLSTANASITNVLVVPTVAGGATTLDQTDTVTFFFSKDIDPTSITAGNLNASMALTGAHSWGGSPTVQWGDTDGNGACDVSGTPASNNCVKITLGSSPGVLDNDVVDPADTLVDTNGNSVAGIWTIKTSGPVVNSIQGTTKLKIVFSESVADMNGWSFPDQNPNVWTYNNPPIDLADTASGWSNLKSKFVYASGGSTAISGLDYVSGDGKTVVLNLTAAADVDDLLTISSLAADSGMNVAIPTDDGGAPNNKLGGSGAEGYKDASYNGGSTTVTLTAGTAPIIESVDIMTGGGFGFMDTAGGGSGALSPGSFVRIRFSKSMSMGSITNENLNTVLPISGKVSPWGTAWTNVWWMSEGGLTNNVVEINVGDGATAAHGDTVGPITAVSDESGVALNSNNNTFVIDTSMAEVSKMTFTDNGTVGISSSDVLVFEFNKSMNTSLDGFSTDGCATPIDADNLEIEMQVDISAQPWYFYPINIESMGANWARRNRPFGTTGVVMQWGKTTSGSCDKLTVTFGTSPTIESGDNIYFDPMWITTQSGKSLMTYDLTLDITAPELTAVYLADTGGQSVSADTAGDMLYFIFSKPIDQTTISASNVSTRLAVSSDDYGATPTLTWISPTLLAVTIANAPSSAVAVADTVVPTADIKDNNGNAITTPPSPAVAVAAMTAAPVTTVVLTDVDDTINPGIDKYDMRVSFTEPAAITEIDHYNVYILPSDVALASSLDESSTNCKTGVNGSSYPGGTACHRVNSLDIAKVSAGGAITYNLSSTSYAIYDDSRFTYLNDGSMPDGKTWYPFMPEKHYVAYVVGCLDDTCSSSTMAVGSSPVQFTMQMMNFNFDDAMTMMGMGTGADSTGMGIVAGGDFWVEGTEPFPGARDIPTNITKMAIKFSHSLNESSINYTSDCSTLCIRKKDSSTGVWTALTSGISTSYEADHFAIMLKITAGTLVANSEYELKIAGASSGFSESSFGNLIKSEFGVAIPGDYWSTFATGAGADTSSPQVIDDKFMAEGIDWSNTGSSSSPYEVDLGVRLIEEVGVRFDKSMDPTTFSSTSVTLKYDGTYDSGAAYNSGQGETAISGSVDYDPFDRTAHFWLDSALPASKNFKLTISGTLVKDMAGNRLDGDRDGVAGGDYTLYFNTSGTMDVSGPEITWADADGFWLGIGFNGPMKESTITNASNWTLSTDTGNVSLSGANFKYDQYMSELHIDGLSLSSGDTYTLTANSSIKGLNGTPISTATTCNYNNDGTQSNSACNAFAGTVHGFMGKGATDCASGFEFGCSTDDVFNPDVMTFMPIDAWPMTMIAGQPSRYMINFPITQAIDHGGTIIIKYPSSFDISGAAIANKDTESFMNWDFNGPGTGIVRVRSVSGTASGGSTTTLVDTTSGVLSATNDAYNGYVLFITSGANKNSYRTISDYVGGSKTITLKNAFSTALASGVTYEIQYITKNALTNTITLILDIDEDEDGSFADEAAKTSTTMTNDLIGFELKGIVNGDAAEMDWSTFPPKGGYTLELTTKDSSGKTLNGPLTTMPFEIKKAGPGIVSGKVTKIDGTTGIANARVFLDGPAGHLEKTTGSDGSFRFSGLEVPSNSGEEWYYWLMVDPPETGNYFQGNGAEVKLTSTVTGVTGEILKLKSGDSTISGKLVHESSLTTDGQIVRIWANGPEGWLDKELTLDGKQATSSSVRSASACSTAGLDLTGFTTPVCSEYIVDLLNGEWNISVEPFFAMTKMTMGPPPEPPFMPPSSKLVTVSGSKSGVNFNLKSATLSITGSVVDQDGAGLAGVEVWSYNSSGNFGFGAHTQTKTDGTFRLKTAEGMFQVGVMITGILAPPEQGIKVTEGGNTPTSLTFTVNKPGTTVNGTIYDENFDPIQFAGISAYNSTTGMFVPAPANNKGVYTLYLENGTWDIEAHAPGYGRLKTSTGLDRYTITIAGTDLTGKDFSATGVAQGETSVVTFRTISGTIVDSNNTAVAGAMVFADEVDSTSNGKTGKGNKAITNSDGEYTIKIPANVSGESTYTISAQTDSGALTEKTSIDVSSANSTNQNWSLAEKRVITVTVNGIPAGITLDVVRVEAFNTSTMNGKTIILEDLTTTDNTGSISLLGGTYDVKAYIPGFGQISPAASSLTSGNYIVSGATTKALTFDISGITTMTLSGTIADGDGTGIADAWVSAFDTTTGVGTDVETDSDGNYTLKVACTSDCNYEIQAHAGGGFLPDKYATAIATTTANLDIALDTANAVITGTLYKADGETPATEAYIFAVEKGGDKKVEAYPDANGQFSLSVDSASKWNVFAGTDDGKMGSLLNVDAEATTDVDYTDVTVSLTETIAGFTQVDPAVATVVPSQGGKVSDEAKNQDMLDDMITAGTLDDYTYASLDAADVITIDTTVIIDANDLGNDDFAYTVMIETLPPLHSLDKGNVLGVEKEIQVLDENGKEVSMLNNVIDIEMAYDKVDIKNIVDQTTGLTTSNIGTSLNNLGASYYAQPTPSGLSSEWQSTATTKKVQVQVSAGASWTAVDFDTFIDNIDASDGDGNGFDHYNDFKITIATTMKHLTPLGGILTGTDDTTAPGAPTGLSVTANSTSVELTWTAPTTNADDLQEYAIYRGSTSSVAITGGSEDQRNSSTVSSASFTDSSSFSGSAYDYYYVVTAYDDNGNQSVASTVVLASYAPGGMIITTPPSSPSSSPPTTPEEDTDDEPDTEPDTTPGEESEQADAPQSVPTEAPKSAREMQIDRIQAQASIVHRAKVAEIIAALGVKRDLAREKELGTSLVAKIVGVMTPLPQIRYALINFITYGTAESLSLGEGERAGVINSFKEAFGKLPATEADWQDVLKIAVGRWPSQTSETKEAAAEVTFEEIYLRAPDRANPNDDAAVVVMAYGLRPGVRNLDSEAAAIEIYERIFGASPETATEWDAARAIAYSGATR